MMRTLIPVACAGAQLATLLIGLRDGQFWLPILAGVALALSIDAWMTRIRLERLRDYSESLGQAQRILDKATRALERVLEAAKKVTS